MDDLIDEMGPAEARHADDIAELWADYGPALRAWGGLDGGMTWKSVSGGQYLCRYRQDRETGKKRFTSLGRRSPETEAIYRDFVERRDAAKHTVISNRDRMITAGRVAKAYGLARLPTQTAQILRALWKAPEMDDRLAVFGGIALFGYEFQSHLVAPADLVRDDALLLVRLQDLEIQDVRKLYEDAVGGDARVTRRDDAVHIRAPGAPELELWDLERILRLADGRDEAAVLEDALRQPPGPGLTIARDAQPVEMRVFQPTVYAMAAQVLGREDGLWLERARFAAAVAERLGVELTAEQQQFFPEIAAGDFPESPRI